MRDWGIRVDDNERYRHHQAPTTAGPSPKSFATGAARRSSRDAIGRGADGRLHSG